VSLPPASPDPHAVYPKGGREHIYRENTFYVFTHTQLIPEEGEKLHELFIFMDLMFTLFFLFEVYIECVLSIYVFSLSRWTSFTLFFLFEVYIECVLSIYVFSLYICSLYICVLSIFVFSLYMCSLYMYSFYIRVLSIYTFSLYMCSLSACVLSIYVFSLYSVHRMCSLYICVLFEVYIECVLSI